MVEAEQKINTEKVPKKKNTSKDKPANGILKRSERRAHTIKGSERIMKSSNSITWDNKAINDQINYRKNHPMNKEKLKDSKSKFANALVENDEDDYSKGLKKVNQLNKNDGIIYKVILALYGQLKSIKRNKSCVTFGKFQRKIDMTEFYNATEKEKFFGADLRDEQKITLSNTLFNKIRKEVIEEN